MKNEVKTSADKLKTKNKIKKFIKIALLVLILLLLILYIIFGILFNHGSFSIRLDPNLYHKNGIIIYDDPDYKVFRTHLTAPTLDFMDNIKHTWLDILVPNIHEHPGGSHNGDNYLAYTFYVENTGQNVADYWAEIIIDDVTRNVDEAIRVRVYRNGERTTYAKISRNGSPEPDTVPFFSDTIIKRERVEGFAPGDINKYTVIMWIEGTDPECTDNILGGLIRIHMDFKSEVIIRN